MALGADAPRCQPIWMFTTSYMAGERYPTAAKQCWSRPTRRGRCALQRERYVHMLSQSPASMPVSSHSSAAPAQANEPTVAPASLHRAHASVTASPSPTSSPSPSEFQRDLDASDLTAFNFFDETDSWPGSVEQQDHPAGTTMPQRIGMTEYVPADTLAPADALDPEQERSRIASTSSLQDSNLPRSQIVEMSMRLGSYRDTYVFLDPYYEGKLLSKDNRCLNKGSCSFAHEDHSEFGKLMERISLTQRALAICTHCISCQEVRSC